MGHPEGAELSSRELQVLQLLAQGNVARAIGDILGITKRTVHAHVRSATLKLDASNCAHAVAKAVRDRLITP
jgi:DNA-binding CsgD family transcriptional regulator